MRSSCVESSHDVVLPLIFDRFCWADDFVRRVDIFTVDDLRSTPLRESCYVQQRYTCLAKAWLEFPRSKHKSDMTGKAVAELWCPVKRCRYDMIGDATTTWSTDWYTSPGLLRRTFKMVKMPTFGVKDCLWHERARSIRRTAKLRSCGS